MQELISYQNKEQQIATLQMCLRKEGGKKTGKETMTKNNGENPPAVTMSSNWSSWRKKPANKGLVAGQPCQAPPSTG